MRSVWGLADIKWHLNAGNIWAGRAAEGSGKRGGDRGKKREGFRVEEEKAGLSCFALFMFTGTSALVPQNAQAI